jgi:hypothetical protein
MGAGSSDERIIDIVSILVRWPNDLAALVHVDAGSVLRW